MGWTQDCDEQISGEHYISASVLKHLSGSNVMLHRVHWLARMKPRPCPSPPFKAKILCKRHNEALAGLDAMVGELFSTLSLVYDDVFDKKTLSRRAMAASRQGQSSVPAGVGGAREDAQRGCGEFGEGD